MKNRKKIDLITIIVCLILGLLSGSALIRKYTSDVEKEVKRELNKVVMIDVSYTDIAVEEFLDHNTYNYKYLTAIDLADKSYGIYEIDNNNVKSYAHGHCESVGKAAVGIYEIVDTQSHIDYHDIRYWRVVNLKERITQTSLVVTSSGYVIDDAPRDKAFVENNSGFGNVMIDSGIMLTVYDNSEPGIVLLVSNEGNYDVEH